MSKRQCCGVHSFRLLSLRTQTSVVSKLVSKSPEMVRISGGDAAAEVEDVIPQVTDRNYDLSNRIPIQTFDHVTDASIGPRSESSKLR